MKGILLPVAEFVINVVICVVVVSLTQRVLNFNVAQDILIGSVLFVALEVTYVNYRLFHQKRYIEMIEGSKLILEEIGVAVTDLARLEHVGISLDERTKRISEGLKTIITDDTIEKDLFISGYQEKLDALIRHIAHTIEAKSYYMDANSSIQEQDRLNEVFRGRKTDYFWATSSCQGMTWFVTARGEIYLGDMYRKFAAGQITEVRRLFIYDNDSELSSFITQLCFLLHQQSGWEYRIISRQDFEAVFSGFGDRNLVVDFGIFGEHFVWETAAENKASIESGYVCVDQQKVRKYTQIYQMMWSHAINYEVVDEQLKGKYEHCHIDGFRALYLSATHKARP